MKSKLSSNRPKEKALSASILRCDGCKGFQACPRASNLWISSLSRFFGFLWYKCLSWYRLWLRWRICRRQRPRFKEETLCERQWDICCRGLTRCPALRRRRPSPRWYSLLLGSRSLSTSCCLYWIQRRLLRLVAFHRQIINR